MNRGLWMVVGKVSGLMIIAGLIGVAKADFATSGIAVLGVLTYGLAMYNIIVYDQGPDEADVTGSTLENRPAERRGL